MILVEWAKSINFTTCSLHGLQSILSKHFTLGQVRMISYCLFVLSSFLITSQHHQQLSTTTDTESTTSDVNYIGLLNEYCQRFKEVCDFKSVGKKGPAHVPEWVFRNLLKKTTTTEWMFLCSNRSRMTDKLFLSARFVYRVVIDKNEYPEGRGRTVKEAKQKAAQLAYYELSLGLSSQVKLNFWYHFCHSKTYIKIHFFFKVINFFSPRIYHCPRWGRVETTPSLCDHTNITKNYKC